MEGIEKLGIFSKSSGEGVIEAFSSAKSPSTGRSLIDDDEELKIDFKALFSKIRGTQ